MHRRLRMLGRLTVTLLLCASVPAFGAASASADPVPSTTSLSASSASPLFGSAVTLQAQVTGTGVATGTVTFLDGTTTIGTAPLDANGAGQISISTLVLGAH